MKNQKLTVRLAVTASKLVKGIAVFSANSSSPFGIYQPVEPKEMAKFKKESKK